MIVDTWFGSLEFMIYLPALVLWVTFLTVLWLR